MENKVLAVVNGKEITQSDFDMLLQSIGPQRAMQFQSEEGQKQLVDELVHQELFYFDAVAAKLDEAAEFVAELEQVKVNLLKQFGIRQLLGSVTIADEDAKAYYDANTQMFTAEESVKASHILVDTEEKINDVIAKLNGGADFAEVAQECSSCPSKENGGDLGFFTRGKMVPEFETVSFAMEVGQVSDAVQTQFGYHVIKVTEKKDGGIMSFEEVAEQVKHNLLLSKQQEVYMNKIEGLKKIYPVEVK